MGGVLARRWALPNRLATAIERHHADDVEGEAALVRLADMLAHYGHAQTVNPKQLLQAARACGLTTEQLRSVMYELPQGTGQAKRNVDPCPLSTREVEVLKRLAEGKVYKKSRTSWSSRRARCARTMRSSARWIARRRS